MFSASSHQIPFVPIKFSSKSFCSHNFPSTSLCSLNFLLFPTQPNPTLHKPTQSSKFCERLGQSAKRSAPVPGQARKGKATVTGRRLSGAAEQKVGIFLCLSGFVDRSWADRLLARQSAALLPSCACAIMRNERVWDHNEWAWAKRISSAQPGAEVPPAPSR